jgi:hypothetical protein
LIRRDRGEAVVSLGQLDLVLAPMLEYVKRFVELHILDGLTCIGAIVVGRLGRLRYGIDRVATGRRRYAAFGRCLLAIVEVMEQVALVDLILVVVELGALRFERRERGFGQLGDDIGRDADGLDRAAIRSVVARGGQAQGGIIVERQVWVPTTMARR